MLDLIRKFLSWISSFWSKIPDPVKEKIIAAAVELFDTILRRYFRDSKEEDESNKKTT